jgi:hypothetical protein
MRVYKRGRKYWLDTVVNNQRYREPLGTTDWRHARQLGQKRVAELTKHPTSTKRGGISYGTLDVSSAINAYANERRSQVSPRMVAYWKENGKPLAVFFGNRKL